MNATVINSFLGLGLGYGFTQLKNNEDKIKQGKNYYQASHIQNFELAHLEILVKKVVDCVFKSPASKSIKILVNVVSLLNIPFGLFAACVKKGDYDARIKYLTNSRLSFLTWILPKSLNQRTVQILSFFAEHTGDLARIAMAVSSIVLIYFGCYAFGITVLSTLVYQEIDARGLVPVKVSELMKNYLPVISNVGLLLCGGTLFNQALAAFGLVTQILPPVSRFIINKLDAFVDYIFATPGTSLADYEAPLVEKRNMTAKEINQILDQSDADYEINPAHCSKSAITENDLPKDSHFQEIIEIFNKVKWEQKYEIIKFKLQDDEIFRDFLIEKFPGKNVQENFEQCITDLAQKAHQPKEMYVAQWMRDQINTFVNVLLGQQPGKETEADLEMARSNCTIILFFLKHFLSDTDRENLLLKLAIKAGNYCNSGINRASSTIVDELIISQGKLDSSFDPQKNYEIEIRRALQRERRKQAQTVTQELFPVDVCDYFYTLVSFEFYPTTTSKKNSLLWVQYLTWKTYSRIRSDMHVDYLRSLDRIVCDQGEKQFATYIEQSINTNPTLSQSEKNTLLDKYMSAYSQRDFKKSIIINPRLSQSEINSLLKKYKSARDSQWDFERSINTNPTLSQSEKNTLLEKDKSASDSLRDIEQIIYTNPRLSLSEKNTLLEKYLSASGSQRDIQQSINTNPTLSQSEKDTLLEKYNSASDSQWDEDLKSFHRLLLVMLGVLRPTKDKKNSQVHQFMNQVQNHLNPRSIPLTNRNPAGIAARRFWIMLANQPSPLTDQPLASSWINGQRLVSRIMAPCPFLGGANIHQDKIVPAGYFLGNCSNAH